MTKRKRSVESAVQGKLEKHRIDLFRAISSAKAAERKRFGARLKEAGISREKKTRLQLEYDVLKKLDLRKVARDHLHASLLRIKAVESSADIPQDLRSGVPRPNLSEEEITRYNNVVSMLCNTGAARQTLERAVADVCETLGVAVPEKAKRGRRNNRAEHEEQPSDRIDEDAEGESDEGEDVKSVRLKVQEELDLADGEKEDEDDEEEEFQGFSSDDGKADVGARKQDGADEDDVIKKYDNLLGGSSDESEEDEFDEDFRRKYGGRQEVDLDDISLSGSASDVDGSDYDLDDDDDDDAEGGVTVSPAPKKAKQEPSVEAKGPAPEKKETKAEREESRKKSATKKAAKTARSGDSTFLPTLMGGYISGSESASDIDAPPKKRRGQRARQAIWEKKYGASAKHLQKAAAKGGRDAGWDMKRGAVEPGDDGRGRKGRGRGRGAPAGRGGGHAQAREREAVERSRPPPMPTKKDDEGPLHPSWQARKMAKDAEKSATFSGTKITFD